MYDIVLNRGSAILRRVYRLNIMVSISDENGQFNIKINRLDAKLQVTSDILYEFLFTGDSADVDDCKFPSVTYLESMSSEMSEIGGMTTNDNSRRPKILKFLLVIQFLKKLNDEEHTKTRTRTTVDKIFRGKF